MLVSFSVQSQDCESAFIERFTKAYTKNQKWLNKKAKKIYRNHGNADSDSVSFIFEVEVWASKFKECDYNPDIVLCKIDYWNKRYTYALVFKDTHFKGIIDIFDEVYHDSAFVNTYFKAHYKLFEELRNNKIDLAFDINGFGGNCYWYIANEKLFVLAHSENDNGYKIYNASSYMHTVYDPLMALFGRNKRFKTKY